MGPICPKTILDGLEVHRSSKKRGAHLLLARAPFGKGCTFLFMLERALACELAARGDASARSSDDSAMRTLLHRGDVSRGFSTESARATLLQGGDAFRASSAGLLGRPRYKAVMLRPNT